MRYYVHTAIATYEVIFAQLTPAPEFGVLPCEAVAILSSDPFLTPMIPSAPAGVLRAM